MDLRIWKVQLVNFKNVGYGVFEFPQTAAHKLDIADILGFYGANGSGKTTVISALIALQEFVKGSVLSESGLVRQTTTEPAEITFDFIGKENDYYYNIQYSCRFNEINAVSEDLRFKKYKKNRALAEFKEILSNNTKEYTYKNSRIDFSDRSLGSLEVIKKGKELKSGFFDSDNLILNILKPHISKTFYSIMLELRRTVCQNLVLLHSQFASYTGQMLHTKDYTEEGYKRLTDNIKIVNAVLPELIPDLKVYAQKTEKFRDTDGCLRYKVDCFTERNGIKISMHKESSGIRKLFAVLMLLISVYKRPEIIFVIDEFDAGLYEFLLGQVIVVLEKSGRGQMLFTSHNLRILELLSPSNIILTTANPNNRYIKFKKIKSTNNLRDIYIKTIQLGGAEEPLYDNIRESFIKRAFDMADSDA